ncbi:MAG TPA: IS21 family transposase [Solirubrobacteraceae bacterium]|jgi:transposase|nr:IS21 family transposase [Solirubrobacteraceae bacterium]
MEGAMISPELEARVLRLYHAEKWRVHTIARQVGIHHSTVRRVLVHAGVAAAAERRWPSKIEPYVGFIQATLASYPSLTAARLYEMVRQRGYVGSQDHFRHLVALHRPRPAAEAYLRLRTLRGEQGQVDWASFGKLQVGAASRSLLAFIMVLSWSRQIFLRFFLSARMENFLRGHEAAFLAWQGCPRVLLYDNLKSAVLERHGNAIRLHPTLLAFAAHYRFEPRPVAVARGNEKGRVERAVQYVRQSFFAGRTVTDLDELNAAAVQWCSGLAAERRCPEDRTLSVAEAFDQERPTLMAVPPNEFPTDELQPVHVGKTPYVRFDGNDYSVPHTRVRRTLVVVADPKTVRVLDGRELVATHPRSYSHGEQIEIADHIAALVSAKRHASEHRGLDRLRRAVPRIRQLYLLLAQRGEKLASATTALLSLLDLYGAAELDRALAEALAKDSPHPQTVRLVLERNQQGQPPSLPLPLPDDARHLRDYVVKPHDLDTYDALIEEADDDDDTGN